MRKLTILICLIRLLVFPVSASELTAPTVPDSARQFMPDSQTSFGMGVLEVLQHALTFVRPDIREAATVCLSITVAVIIISITKSIPGMTQKCADLAGMIFISAILINSTDSMIHMASDSITEISEYGKLLLPVMTSALAAQGGISASVAVYSGTLIFDTLFSALISSVLVPMIYVFLALSIASGALGEQILKKMQTFLKWLMTWCLKTVLTVFTGYISITGVISGTTDAAALKVTKLTISGFVPVVGGILSDASEAVLVGAATVKNAAGIYGLFAILAICIGPFLHIGSHYLLLKLTAGICGIFGSKEVTELIGDFSTAMGLLLGMTGAVSLMLMISTICFMKGVG